MPSYYCGFDITIVNDYGVTEPQGGVTVTVYNETDSSSLSSLTADANGHVASGSLSVAADKVIRFSVSGYTPVIRRTTAATEAEAHYGVTDLNLILDNTFVPTTNTTAYNEVTIKGELEEEPIFAGRLEAGAILKVPYNPALDGTLNLFAIAKDEKGAADVIDLNQAFSITYTPNRDIGTPDFFQVGSAQNLQIDFEHTGFTTAQFRKVQYATNNTFTTGLVERIDGALNMPLNKSFSITRGSGSGTLLVYVRIAHSTNNQTFGSWSATKTATFADSGGSGGSGAGSPPSDLYGYLSGNSVYLTWTAGSGTNTVYRNGSSIGTGSGSFTDSSLTPGTFYSYYVSNSDGSTDFYSLYYSGNEF